MAKIEIPLSTGQYSGRSNELTHDLNINVYAEVDPNASKVKYLVGTPGQELATTVTGTGGNHRVGGSIYRNGIIYAVVGDTLYSLDSSLTATSQGTLNTSSGRLSMAASDDYVVIVDGTDGYVYDIAGDSFSTIGDGDFPSSPVKVMYFSQYFIVLPDDSARFYVSDITTGPTSWIATDFATKQKQGDNITSIFIDNEELLLLGEETSETWVLTGNADFPFETFKGGFMQKGCAAIDSVAHVDNSVAWLAQDSKGGYQVCMLAGQSTPKVISTASISYFLENLTSVSDCYAYTLIFEGNEFYVMNFPTDGKTLAYNVVSKEWFEWPYYDGSSYSVNLGAWSLFANGENYMGARNSRKIYKLNSSEYQNDSVTPKREFTGELIDNKEGRLFIREVLLDIEEGVGNVDSTNPTIELFVSKDGGSNYTSYGTRELGASSEPGKRVVWRSNLYGRRFIFKFVITEPVKLIVKRLLVTPRYTSTDE